MKDSKAFPHFSDEEKEQRCARRRHSAPASSAELLYKSGCLSDACWWEFGSYIQALYQLASKQRCICSQAAINQVKIITESWDYFHSTHFKVALPSGRKLHPLINHRRSDKQTDRQTDLRLGRRCRYTSNTSKLRAKDRWLALCFRSWSLGANNSTVWQMCEPSLPKVNVMLHKLSDSVRETCCNKQTNQRAIATSLYLAVQPLGVEEPTKVVRHQNFQTAPKCNTSVAMPQTK